MILPSENYELWYLHYVELRPILLFEIVQSKFTMLNPYDKVNTACTGREDEWISNVWRKVLIKIAIIITCRLLQRPCHILQ